MISTLVLKDIRAVGMHHHCLIKQLDLGMKYTAQWEPICVYDPGNAIAVKDHRNITRAYFTREDAAIVSRLFCANVIVGKMYVTTRVERHVEVQNLGPQQECVIQCKIKTTDLDLAKCFVEKLNYEFH